MIHPGGLPPSNSRLLLDAFRQVEAKVCAHEGALGDAMPPPPPIPFTHLGPTTVYVGQGPVMYSKIVNSTFSASA